MVLVFATGFGLKKFLEAFASEAGRKLAEKLFSPTKPEQREKKVSEFAERFSVPREDVRYDLIYKVAVRVDEGAFGDGFSLSEMLDPPADSAKFQAVAVEGFTAVFRNYEQQTGKDEPSAPTDG